MVREIISLPQQKGQIMENITEMQTWEMIMCFVVGIAIIWWYTWP